MTTVASPVPVDPFALLSHYATAQMIYAADGVGIWKALASAGDSGLDVDEFATIHKLSIRSLKAITDYLVRTGLFDFTDSANNRIRLTPEGHAFLNSDCLGHFALLVGAYGHVLHCAGELAAGRMRYGVDIRRHPEVLAIASTKIGQSKVHSSYKVVLEHVGTGNFGCVVDIGCGAADFLALLAQRTQAQSVLGVDVLPEACELARRRLSTIGIQSEVICGNIGTPQALLDGYSGRADLVTALFVLHELIGKSPSIEHALFAIKALLNPTGRLLLLEKATDVLQTTRNPPYFSEFKLVHDLTDQNLCERSQWRELLRRVGFKIQQERVLAPHTGSVLFECSLLP